MPISVSVSAAFPGRYLSLTSYKSDGTEVMSSGWFVEEGGRLLVQSDMSSGETLIGQNRRDMPLIKTTHHIGTDRVALMVHATEPR